MVICLMFVEHLVPLMTQVGHLPAVNTAQLSRFDSDGQITIERAVNIRAEHDACSVGVADHMCKHVQVSP